MALRGRVDLFSDLVAIEMFLALVDTRSFSRGAQLLGVSTSTLSKKLAELERKAGTRFVVRSSRTIKITDAGTQFYMLGQRLLGDAERLEKDLLRRDGIGRLRVRAPVVLAERRLAQLMFGFAAAHPGVEFNLLALVEGSAHLEPVADISLSIKSDLEITDSMTVIAPQPRMICAAPKYLDAFGVPQTIEDLKSHNCLAYQIPGRAPSFDVNIDQRATSIPINGTLVSDNASILLGAAREGHGIVQLGKHVVERDLEEGRLRTVLSRFNPRPKKIVALPLDSEFVPPLATVFLDYLKRNWPT